MEKGSKEKDFTVNTAGVFKPKESSRLSVNPALQYTINNELYSYWITESPQELAERGLGLK